MTKKFYVTTPIYYVNDKPHIGHAYTTIAADVLARYHRLRGEDVFFLTGTDEHGLKNYQAAEKAGLSPQEFVDQKAAQYELAWDSLNVSYNDFIRTTQPRHHEAVKIFLEKLRQARTPKGNAAVYEDDYEGWYCVGCESYKTESELVDGKCPDHNTVPELIKEKNWFFRLSDFGEVIEQKILAGETVVAPEARKNEVLSLIRQGLKDVSMSRHIKWGIRLPFDENQVAWVWFDALPNYISALGYPDGELFKKFWPASVHLMAKEILKFHTVIWMSMLMALDLPLPKMVFAHGFFTIDGKKMSKTLGNVIDPIELAAEYGADAVRFFLLSEFAFGSDGDVSVEKFKDRYNAFLANGLGNVAARVLTLVEKYREHLVKVDDSVAANLTKEVWANYEGELEKLQFDNAIGEIWRLLSWCDSYVEEHKPWELAKTNTQKLGAVLYELMEVLRHAAWLLYPFLPETSEKLLVALNVWNAEDKWQEGKIKSWGGLTNFAEIKRPEILFPRK